MEPTSSWAWTTEELALTYATPPGMLVIPVVDDAIVVSEPSVATLETVPSPDLT